MKKNIAVVFSMLLFTIAAAVAAHAGVKYEESYSFDRCNLFKIEFYAKKNELMSTAQYKTFYQSNGENFYVKLVTEKYGSGMESIIDKKNEVAIQIFGTGGGAKPFYNAGGYKYPTEQEIKKLEIVPTSETKQILGFNCKKYTYTYKKIFGEVWITDEVSLPNDIGVFRACKMAALHNTLSVNGFVMEMTTEDSRGGRTLMTTVSLKNEESCTVDLKGVEMNKAINKVDYFKF